MILDETLSLEKQRLVRIAILILVAILFLKESKMFISVPYYLVALGAAFLYAVIYQYFPNLPLTQDQVLWLVLTILAALNVDVTQAIYRGRSIR